MAAPGFVAAVFRLAVAAGEVAAGAFLDAVFTDAGFARVITQSLLSPDP